MASFFGTGNAVALARFWKQNTDQRKGEGSYLQRMITPGVKSEGKSRAQTTEIRLIFSDKNTQVLVTMENGKQRNFVCKVFRQSDARQVGIDFGKILDGNEERSPNITDAVKPAKPGQVLILTHTSIKLEDQKKEEAKDGKSGDKKDPS